MIGAAKAGLVEPNATTADRLLEYLDRPVQALQGVGSSVATAMGRLLGTATPKARDLLTHLPRDWLDPTPLVSLDGVADGTDVTLDILILGHERARTRSRPHVARASSADGLIDLVWFAGNTAWVERRFVTGGTYRAHGRLQRHGGRLQLPHPELLPVSGDRGDRLLPIYPAIAGLTQATLRRVLGHLVEALPEAPEWLPRALVTERTWPCWQHAWRTLHGGSATPVDRSTHMAAWEMARRRLALDELVALQLALALERADRSRRNGRSTCGAGILGERLLGSLPFTLTADQVAAAARIQADQAAPSPMLRLLQGDVGSGKTLVAFLAMLRAVEAGRQAVLLAPTELLCRQHHATICAWTTSLGLEVALLTGRGGKRARKAALSALGDGRVRLVVGTHALLEEDVRFADLALAVIDEQHRFGVAQRLALAEKGAAIDLLFLSATPIPRTLLLAAYGDIAVSSLREKPAGRQPVRTRVVPRRRLAEVIAATGRALERGEQIFWVCPSIAPVHQPSEASPIAAAQERFEELRRQFGDKVGLVHGKQRAGEREAGMAAFRDGTIRLLVATTVIEVGVDVPAASVMIVESAERFGLSQLHQLRGRVGRGARASTCLLVYDDAAGSVARRRLVVLRRTEDGFAIAEADLAIRGPGELLGPRQSGLPTFAVADLARDQDLLVLARELARRWLDDDPALEQPSSAALRLLLRLHGRDEALPLLGAG